VLLPLVLLISVASDEPAPTTTTTATPPASTPTVVETPPIPPPPPPPSKPAPRKIEATKVVLLDLKGDVSASDKAVITDLIATLMTKRGLDVLTASDVRQVADLAAQSATMGCDLDSSCLADVANAMGAKYVVFGSAGRLGRNYLVSVNLFDQSLAQSAARETIRAADLDALPQQIEEGVGRLVDKIAAPAVVPPPPPPKQLDLMFIGGASALGIGLAATGGLGIATFVFDNAAGNATTRKTFDDARGAGLGCLAGTAAAAAVAAAGAVLVTMSLGDG
jgi:hypothetical protein